MSILLSFLDLAPSPPPATKSKTLNLPLFLHAYPTHIHTCPTHTPVITRSTDCTTTKNCFVGHHLGSLHKHLYTLLQFAHKKIAAFFLHILKTNNVFWGGNLLFHSMVKKICYCLQKSDVLQCLAFFRYLPKVLSVPDQYCPMFCFLTVDMYLQRMSTQLLKSNGDVFNTDINLTLPQSLLSTLVCLYNKKILLCFYFFKCTYFILHYTVHIKMSNYPVCISHSLFQNHVTQFCINHGSQDIPIGNKANKLSLFLMLAYVAFS